MSKIPDYALRPSYDHTTPESVLKKLAEYEKKNQERMRRKIAYKYNPIRLPNAVDKFVNPEAFKTPAQTDRQQVGELIRMSKMHAKTARLNRDDAGYAAERDKFFRDFSNQISKYNLYTKMYEIWNLFSDKSYSEPAFDKDYLGTSASTDYLKSLKDRLEAESTGKKVVLDAMGAAGVSTLDKYEETDAPLNIEDADNKIKALREELAAYEDASSKIEETMVALENEYAALKDEAKGKGVLTEALQTKFDAIKAEIDERKKSFMSYLDDVDSIKSDIYHLEKWRNRAVTKADKEIKERMLEHDRIMEKVNEYNSARTALSNPGLLSKRQQDVKKSKVESLSKELETLRTRAEARRKKWEEQHPYIVDIVRESDTAKDVFRIPVPTRMATVEEFTSGKVPPNALLTPPPLPGDTKAWTIETPPKPKPPVLSATGGAGAGAGAGAGIVGAPASGGAPASKVGAPGSRAKSRKKGKRQPVKYLEWDDTASNLSKRFR